MTENDLTKESLQVNSLIEKGMKFQVNGQEYTIYEPPAAVLDLLSAAFLEMEFDEIKLQENPIAESKALIGRCGRLCAKVVAIAVLGKQCKWSLGKPDGKVFLTRTRKNRIDNWTEYFFLHVKPSELVNLALIINTMCNYGDFINAIRLMSGARTTAPTRIANEPA